MDSFYIPPLQRTKAENGKTTISKICIWRIWYQALLSAPDSITRKRSRIDNKMTNRLIIIRYFWRTVTYYVSRKLFSTNSFGISLKSSWPPSQYLTDFKATITYIFILLCSNMIFKCIIPVKTTLYKTRVKYDIIVVVRSILLLFMWKKNKNYIRTYECNVI